MYAFRKTRLHSFKRIHPKFSGKAYAVFYCFLSLPTSHGDDRSPLDPCYVKFMQVKHLLLKRSKCFISYIIFYTNARPPGHHQSKKRFFFFANPVQKLNPGGFYYRGDLVLVWLLLYIFQQVYWLSYWSCWESWQHRLWNRWKILWMMTAKPRSMITVLIVRPPYIILKLFGKKSLGYKAKHASKTISNKRLDPVQVQAHVCEYGLA